MDNELPKHVARVASRSVWRAPVFARNHGGSKHMVAKRLPVKRIALVACGDCPKTALSHLEGASGVGSRRSLAFAVGEDRFRRLDGPTNHTNSQPSWRPLAMTVPNGEPASLLSTANPMLTFIEHAPVPM